MRGRRRSASVLGLMALCTAGGLLFGASPAAADTGGAFDPSNFGVAGDPWVESAAATASTTINNGVLSEGQFAGALMNKIRYAKGWTAITSRLGFGAAQIRADGSVAQQVASMEKAFAPLASRLAPVTKLIGGIAEPVMLAQLGISAGAAVDNAVGVDVSGGLCNGSDGVFSVVNQLSQFFGAADCEKWKMSQELQAALNSDATAHTTSGKFCDPTLPAVCFQVASIAPDGSTVYGRPERVVCMTAASYTDTAVSLVWLGGGGIPEASPQAITGATDPDGCGEASHTTSAYPRYLLVYGGIGAVAWPFPGWRFGDEAGTVSHPVNTTSSDPARTLRCDVVYKDGTTGTASTAVFHESDRAVPPYICPAVPDRKIIDHATIWETGGDFGDIKWQDVPVTPEYQADAVAHPDCQIGQCRLNLIRVSDGLQCLDAGSTCDGWFADPNKTTDYKCVLGPYTDMPLSHCNTYEPTFNAQKVSQGVTYANPVTGVESGQTAPKPSGDPQTGIDPQSGSCFVTGWATVANPIEWVLKPVGCALEWAFVPSPQTITNIETTVSTSLKGSTPGQLITEFEAELPEFSSADSGCDGVLINFPQWSANGSYQTLPQHVMAACPGDYFARWAPLFSVFIGGSFTLVGILGAKRLVSALFGFHDPGVGA